MTGQVKYLQTKTNDVPEPGAVTKPQETTVVDAASAMEQVRELLYGEALRAHGRRTDDVNESLKELEQRMAERFAAMQGSIDALARSLRQEHSAGLRKLGTSIMDMGRDIAAFADQDDRARCDR